MRNANIRRKNLDANVEMETASLEMFLIQRFSDIRWNLNENCWKIPNNVNAIVKSFFNGNLFLEKNLIMQGWILVGCSTGCCSTIQNGVSSTGRKSRF